MQTSDEVEVSASPSGKLEVEEVPPSNNGVKDSGSDSDSESVSENKGSKEAITATP